MDDNEDVTEGAPTFEGKIVSDFEVILPRITVGAIDQYRSGHIVQLATEMRVANVQFKDNKDGTLTRQHFMTWESVEVTAEFDPADQILDGGSSSSSGRPQDDEGEDDDLGLKTGRTGWPDNVSHLPQRVANDG